MRFADDEVVKFSGTDVEDGVQILNALDRHCAEAGHEPARRDRRGPLVTVMSAITLIGAGSAAAAVITISRTVDPDGRTHVGLAMIAVTGAVTAMVTGILLISVPQTKPAG